MTVRKADIPLPVRTPAYVDRELGAAELRISPETWDAWVKNGRLPPTAPGFPVSTPRWRWVDVDAKLAGKTTDCADPYLAGAANLRHGPKPNARREKVAAGG
jgi:hypothetical protein